MSEYTKGPWEAVEREEGLWHIRRTDGTPQSVPVAVIDYHRDGHEPTRTKAAPDRARLIAAAPDLLEALKSINEWLLDVGEPIDRPDVWHPLFFKANVLAAAAIAKANGQTLSQTIQEPSPKVAAK